MYFFSCNICASRGAMCYGNASIPQQGINCPRCFKPLTSVREQRNLLDKIKDAWTPTELVEAINDESR